MLMSNHQVTILKGVKQQLPSSTSLSHLTRFISILRLNLTFYIPLKRNIQQCADFQKMTLPTFGNFEIDISETSVISKNAVISVFGNLNIPLKVFVLVQ
jgi:hypothetical protein